MRSESASVSVNVRIFGESDERASRTVHTNIVSINMFIYFIIIFLHLSYLIRFYNWRT